MKKDFYEVLGISKTSSQDEIKRAYRNLARKYHPDVSKETGAADKFKEINEAYQVLSDPNRRSQYDYYGGKTGGPGGAEGFDFRGFEGFGDLGDLFAEMVFGRGRGGRHAGQEQGEDLRYDLGLTLEEANQGIEKELEIQHRVSCAACKGSGAKPGTTPTRCATCGGSGQVQHSQRTILGSFMQVVPCPACHGSGATIQSPCPTCRGSGREKKKHQVKVKIPIGIDSGYRLRVAGAGNTGGKGGPPGDLYVFISIEPHPRFNRDGANLYHRTEISFVQAILGDEIKVPTLDGEVVLKIPPGTQPNTNFKLKEKGMHHLNKRERGDLYVLVEVKIPAKISREQAELLRRFKNA